MKRPRFTLRAMLAIFTVLALALGVWRQLFFQRRLTREDLVNIEKGMTAFEVRWRLGSPAIEVPETRGEKKQGFYWGFDAPPDTWLDLKLKDGRVVKFWLVDDVPTEAFNSKGS